ncbi:MAG: primosomal protein N' [Pseudomonadota bacterium]
MTVLLTIAGSFLTMNQHYAEIAIACPLRTAFDYAIPEDMALEPGMRVKVPFGRRTVTGVVLNTKNHTTLTCEIKAILESLDETPVLSSDLIQLCTWASQYYQHPIGDVLMGVLPTRLRQGKTLNIRDGRPTGSPYATHPHNLHQEQQAALVHITQNLSTFNVFLLHGVTGSGKTEVYFHVIDEILKKNQQVLFLIPEISLSPQTLQRFQQRFSAPILAMHSGLTDKERLTAWAHAQSGDAKIIIGTRSSIFTPFKNLGLIVIDEEHDASFKQHEGFRYSARNLAIKRAHMLNIPIILGSATPSAESYQNALSKKYHLLELTARAGHAVIPQFQLVPLSPKTLENGLAPETITTIRQHLEKQEQVLIFINRRGYAPAWFCQSCHWQADCTRCDSHMVLHKKLRRLMCHHCGHQTAMPTVCPKCQSPSLLALGEGTQRIAETLETLFPATPVFRIDRDNVKNKNQLEEQLENIHQHSSAILIGTQMLAKGHHFPNVTLVVILGVDNGLMSNDFHALERTAQLILQVGGRAGREDKPGIVLLQTLQPEHPQLQLLTQQPYGVFLKALLKEREQFHLPPFAFMALFRAEAKQMQKASECLMAIQNLLRADTKHGPYTVYDPIPAPMQRKAGFYHMQLLIQAPNRQALQKLLSNTLPKLANNKALQGARWTVDVDPVDLF